MFEFLFNKVSGLNYCNFIKKRLQQRFFPVNFAKFHIITPFYRIPPGDRMVAFRNHGKAKSDTPLRRSYSHKNFKSCKMLLLILQTSGKTSADE